MHRVNNNQLFHMKPTLLVYFILVDRGINTVLTAMDLPQCSLRKIYFVLSRRTYILYTELIYTYILRLLIFLNQCHFHYSTPFFIETVGNF